MGFTSGAASPCCFEHKVRGTNAVVHGDDFKALGTDTDLDQYEKELAKPVEVKI